MIYFLKLDVPGCQTKIGYALDPYKRIEQLKTSIPFDIESVDFVSGNMENEGQLHFMFCEYLHKREWFLGNKEIDNFVDNCRVKHLDVYKSTWEYFNKNNEIIDRLFMEHILFYIKPNIDNIIDTYEAKYSSFGHKVILKDGYKYYAETNKPSYYIGLLKTIKYEGSWYYELNKKYAKYDKDYFIHKYGIGCLENNSIGWKDAKSILLKRNET